MKIVVLDGYASNPGDLSWEPLKEFGEVTIYDRTNNENIIARAKNAEIVITNKVAFNEEIIEKLPNIKMLSVLATGYNIIDCKAARKKGIIVSNVPAYSTMSVALMTFAHILNIYNHVEHYAEENRNNRWCFNQDFCYWDTNIQELDGKTLGIVGLGNIGMHVAKIALDFGMDVFAFTSKNSSDLPMGIQKTTMNGLFSISDILTLHCPLTEGTHELINKESIAKMKSGAIIINTSRGYLVNEKDVTEALKTGKLAAYGADVMVDEPPTEDNPLLGCENAFITPHIAWASKEARQRLLNITFDNIRSFINGKSQNIVD